jgi:hypothetical protein
MKLYRYLTGVDDDAFCHRVTAELNKGWQLHGQPTLTYDQERKRDLRPGHHRGSPWRIPARHQAFGALRFGMVVLRAVSQVVMVGLGPTIQLIACSDAGGWLDPRDEPEDDIAMVVY